MHTLKIRGASDDCIECEGVDFAIRTEFEVAGENFRPDAIMHEPHRSPSFLAISDGTLLGVEYDHDCIWRFKVIMHGKGTRFEKAEGRRQKAP